MIEINEKFDEGDVKISDDLRPYKDLKCKFDFVVSLRKKTGETFFRWIDSENGFTQLDSNPPFSEKIFNFVVDKIERLNKLKSFE